MYLFWGSLAPKLPLLQLCVSVKMCMWTGHLPRSLSYQHTFGMSCYQIYVDFKFNSVDQFEMAIYSCNFLLSFFFEISKIILFKMLFLLRWYIICATQLYIKFVKGCLIMWKLCEICMNQYHLQCEKWADINKSFSYQGLFRIMMNSEDNEN